MSTGGVHGESGKIALWSGGKVTVFRDAQAKSLANQGGIIPVWVAMKIKDGDYEVKYTGE